MKNLWIHTDPAFVTWIADFTAIAKQPASILEFVRALLTAGAAHRIFEVVEAPLIGYRRDHDGALGDVLGRLLEHDRVLDMFGFTGSAMMPGPPTSSIVETTLAYYDREDRLVERVVTDQGAVLASLEPVPDSIPNGFMTHYPAVRITGRRYAGVREGVPVGRAVRITGDRYADVREGAPVDRSAHPLRVAVYLGIHSDIWFPWVYGSAHPDADHRRMFDNRELANRHTPRLNAFLGEVAAAARRIGGSFGVWPDETGGQASTCVDDEGVLLDWLPIAGVMPPEALDAEWS
jgi:hypothetical protein